MLSNLCLVVVRLVVGLTLLLAQHDPTCDSGIVDPKSEYYLFSMHVFKYSSEMLKISGIRISHDIINCI